MNENFELLYFIFFIAFPLAFNGVFLGVVVVQLSALYQIPGLKRKYCISGSMGSNVLKASSTRSTEHELSINTCPVSRYRQPPFRTYKRINTQ